MSKEGFLVQNQRSRKWNLSKYVSGKIKFVSKDRTKDLALIIPDPLKNSNKSRNQFAMPKYKTNDCHNTAFGRFTKDAILQKMPSTGVPKSDNKNTSALVWNYSKISESMTFDYSIDSQASKSKLNKIAYAMINNFDPSSTKSYRKNSNYVSKKVGLVPSYAKKPVLTPKSQSPHNEIAKSKVSKIPKLIRSKYLCHLDRSNNISIEIESSRLSQNKLSTKLDSKLPSCTNLLKAQISQMKLSEMQDHNYTQYLEDDKENIFKKNVREDNKSKDSIGSSVWDRLINESGTKHRDAIGDRFTLKPGRSANIFGNKHSKKPIKKIKQSSIKKNNKENACLNFGTKVVSSVKNAGTSRVSYNQIFYSNKPKSSLKNYSNAMKSYMPKKKSIWRESNSSTQITYMAKNRKDLTTSSRYLTSDKKLHQTESSPLNNKSQGEGLEKYVCGIKNKLIKTISNQQIIHKKLSTKKVKKPKCDDSDHFLTNNISCGLNNDSTESDSSDNENYKQSTNRKEKKIRKIIKKANEELFMAAESGSLTLVKQLLDTKANFRPDINFRGPDFKTPLYTATSEGHIEIIEFLLSEGALIDTRTIWERNPLHISCLRGHTNIAKLLFKGAPDLLNSVDIYGNTPTHYCSKYGNCETLSFLLKHNPKLYIKNKKEKTAIDVAYDEEVIEIFGEYVSKIRQNLKNMSNRNKQQAYISGEIVLKEQIKTDRKSNDKARDSKTSHDFYARKSQDDNTFASNINNGERRKSMKSPKNIEKSKANMKVETLNQRRKSNDPNLVLGLMTNKSKHQPLYSKTGNKQIQPHTDRNHYAEKENIDNLNQFSKLVGKNKGRSRNSGKLWAYNTDKQVHTYKLNNVHKLQKGLNKNPIRMYNTIEDISYVPEFEEVPEVTHSKIKIGPDSFIPIQLLGKGSFGEVYLVQMKCNNKLYAMKILQKDKIFSNNLVRYATTERNVLTYFTKHPFIVNLNFAFQTSTKLFLILDYWPGGDLGQLIQREGYLNEDQAKVYMAEVLLALEDLHDNDIIFRDLKPDNVVIDKDGHVLLTDFGLSKEGIYDNNSASSFWGSVAYLAPEMLKRQGHGKSVDWYLLGVLLYEMLFGKTPYFSESKEELFHNIKSGKLKISRNLSPEAIDILKCLLNRNPHKRLGAGKEGANLIKAHPFFDEIDWDECMERKLNVLKPLAKEITPSNISHKIFNDNAELNDDQTVDGWTFVLPE